MADRQKLVDEHTFPDREDVFERVLTTIQEKVGDSVSADTKRARMNSRILASILKILRKNEEITSDDLDLILLDAAGHGPGLQLLD